MFHCKKMLHLSILLLPEGQKMINYGSKLAKVTRGSTIIILFSQHNCWQGVITNAIGKIGVRKPVTPPSSLRHLTLLPWMLQIKKWLWKFSGWYYVITSWSARIGSPELFVNSERRVWFSRCATCPCQWHWISSEGQSCQGNSRWRKRRSLWMLFLTMWDDQFWIWLCSCERTIKYYWACSHEVWGE
jgi:hypothetical protein